MYGVVTSKVRAFVFFSLVVCFFRVFIVGVKRLESSWYGRSISEKEREKSFAFLYRRV